MIVDTAFTAWKLPGVRRIRVMFQQVTRRTGVDTITCLLQCANVFPDRNPGYAQGCAQLFTRYGTGALAQHVKNLCLHWDYKPGPAPLAAGRRGFCSLN